MNAFLSERLKNIIVVWFSFLLPNFVKINTKVWHYSGSVCAREIVYSVFTSIFLFRFYPHSFLYLHVCIESKKVFFFLSIHELNREVRFYSKLTNSKESQQQPNKIWFFSNFHCVLRPFFGYFVSNSIGGHLLNSICLFLFLFF